MDKRKSDADTAKVAHFRAGSRIFRLNDAWYFSAREGEHGPYVSEKEAAAELNNFLKQIGAAHDDGLFKIEYEPPTRRADPNA